MKGAIALGDSLAPVSWYFGVNLGTEDTSVLVLRLYPSQKNDLGMSFSLGRYKRSTNTLVSSEPRFTLKCHGAGARLFPRAMVPFLNLNLGLINPHWRTCIDCLKKDSINRPRFSSETKYGGLHHTI